MCIRDRIEGKKKQNEFFHEYINHVTEAKYKKWRLTILRLLLKVLLPSKCLARDLDRYRPNPITYH